MLRSLIHLELIFVNQNFMSNFSLLLVDSQSSQCHLLKKLFFSVVYAFGSFVKEQMTAVV
jgi:hypothetical protein